MNLEFAPHELGKNRIEALSDGIFAIAMTFSRRSCACRGAWRHCSALIRDGLRIAQDWNKEER